MSAAPWCCFIDPDTKVACDQPAEWDVVECDVPKHPSECETQACTAHVGELLSDAPWFAVKAIAAVKENQL